MLLVTKNIYTDINKQILKYFYCLVFRDFKKNDYYINYTQSLKLKKYVIYKKI